MAYADVFVMTVPEVEKSRYLALAASSDAVFRAHGALSYAEFWEDAVPEGALTSFPMAVKRAPGEAVVIGWALWPSKAARDAGQAAVMQDPRMQAMFAEAPIDGKRMIFGGFEQIAGG
ncbi:MAG: DUF1428 domain-containing protein [Pseudomonadota bacterium]